MNLTMQLYLSSLVLVLIQAAAALPWVLAAVLGQTPERRLTNVTSGRRTITARAGAWQHLSGSISSFAARLFETLGDLFRSRGVQIALASMAVGTPLAALLLAYLLQWMQDADALLWTGRLFSAVLHFQLIVDLFVLAFASGLLVWPKGAAVAVAAFREGLRQPMYWLLLIVALVLLTLSVVMPYWTFGEDVVMMKELGFDTIMLFALLFGVLSASISISEEIEGRTAITLMSKPISRRQFLLGKFVGIFLCGLLMIAILGWWFNWMVLLRPLFETQKQDPVPDPDFVAAAMQKFVQPSGVPADFLRGNFLWLYDNAENLPALILGSCQLMVMLALAVALATRLTMIINLVICLVIFVLGHLSPVLTEISERRLTRAPNGAAMQLLGFVSKLLDAVLPGTRYFQAGPALVTDSPPTMPEYYGYVGLVLVYAMLFSSILLLAGLLAFEDRDLA
jgi:ABC-type transport system involved in multi-copper enzyme maturation permease subunit